MYQEVSPGVERAAEAARAWAARLGAPVVRLSDWLLGLLDEDEGRPAELLTRLQVDVGTVRGTLPQTIGRDQFPAPSDHHLFARARTSGVELRGDPTLTTDLLLLEVVATDAAFGDVLTGYGIHRTELEDALHRPDVVIRPEHTTATFAVPDDTGQVIAARIVDANLNRARESLRVLDDYARFSLNDPFLTERLKSLRHRLGEASGLLPVGNLLAARDTPGDVGTGLTSGGEYDRTSPAHVAGVNFKRLQEALRSAEEYGKVLGGEFAREVERVRYEAYSLERVIVRGGDVRARLAGADLYILLTGSQCAAALDWTIAEAAAGGAGVIQLREKDLADRELIERARAVRMWTRAAGVLYIVNDRPDIARLAEADGVHLGQDDLPVSEARRVVGPDALIGVSTHSVEQARRAVLDGADYIGVGPTFPSKTKAFDHFPGLPLVTAVTAEMSIPTFVLGGITLETASVAVAAGAKRVAVSSAVASAEDPRSAAIQLRQVLSGGANAPDL